MTEHRLVDSDMYEQGGTRQALKRRGLIAGAAALVAGVVATQATQPVSAGADGDVVLGALNTTQNTTTIKNTDTNGGTALVLHCDDSAFAGSGTGLDASGSAIGVSGTGVTFAGVFGDTSSASASGVMGFARSGLGGIGVSGNCAASSGVGVQGTSAHGTGVIGHANRGLYGVYGISGAPGGVGVRGDCTGGTGVLGTVSDGYGVLGQAVTGNGLYGFSQQNHGVVGQTARPFFGGVLGVATIANTVGIYGSTNNGAGNVAGAYAGYMDGNFVVVNGVKSAAVPHTDGTHRLVYCMESPENWFEDFGKAKLAGGKAAIKLDADFAQIVHTDDYHVFLTAYGNTNGLHVTNQGPGGFTVEEHNGGTASLTFSYRVVAKRKDIAAKRLATFDLPGKVKQDMKAPQVPMPPPKVPEPSADPRKP